MESAPTGFVVECGFLWVAQGGVHMWGYVFRRVVGWFFIVIAAVSIPFLIFYLSPGSLPIIWGSMADPDEFVRDFREIHRLDYPIFIRYVRYIFGVFTGDFGLSFRTWEPIAPQIAQRLPYTLQLGVLSLVASLILVLPLGILVAINKNSLSDKMVKAAEIIGNSTPVFLIAMVLVAFFLVERGSTAPNPLYGRRAGLGPRYNDILILPSIALGFGLFLAMLHTVRDSFLEIMAKPYIKLARSKGISKGRVLIKHVLRNTFIAILSTLRTRLGEFFVGIIMVEYIFLRSGIGRFIIQGIMARDYPRTIGGIVVFIFGYAILNILIDITQALIDPRVKEQGGWQGSPS